MTLRKVVPITAVALLGMAGTMDWDAAQAHQSLEAATQVLIWLCLLLIVGLPLMLWFTLGTRNEDTTKWWFSGLSVIAFGTLALAYLQRSNSVTGSTMVLGTGFFLEALRKEAGKQSLPLRFVLPFVTVIWALYLIEWWGVYSSYGVLLTSLVLAPLQGMLLHALYQVGWPQRSRGLALVAVGVFGVFCVNLARFFAVFLGVHSQPIFSYNGISNAVILSFTLHSVLAAFGFVAYILEKTHHRHMRGLE